MSGEDRNRSLKKFSAIGLVLVLGGTFHMLCWSSLMKRAKGERSIAESAYLMEDATPENCWSLAPKTLLSTR